jgi:hypothetical protein
MPGGQSQPSAVQPAWVIASAIRWALLWNRAFRPRSRTWESVPRTAGMIPAPQAHFRARPGEIRVPVSSWAARGPPSRVSSGIVTTTVAFTPPACGRWSAG